jgi:hypothetical protein
MHWLGKVVRQLRPEFSRLPNSSISVMYEILNSGVPSTKLLVQSSHHEYEDEWEKNPARFFEPAISAPVISPGPSYEQSDGG